MVTCIWSGSVVYMINFFWLKWGLEALLDPHTLVSESGGNFHPWRVIQFPKHRQSVACCNTQSFPSWMVAGALGGQTSPVGLVQMSQITSNNRSHLSLGSWIEPIKSRRFLYRISLSPPFLQLHPTSLGCHSEGDICCGLFQALSALVTWAVSLLYTRAYFQDTCSNVVISETPSFCQTWLKMAKVIQPVTSSLMDSHLLGSISGTLAYNYLSDNITCNNSQRDTKWKIDSYQTATMIKRRPTQAVSDTQIWWTS